MQIELDWQAGDEAGRWETVARIEKRTLPRVPKWAWRVVLPAIILLVACGYLGLRHRYARALRQVASQIQDVIDVEAQSLVRRGLDLYLSQQDRASPTWYARQRDRAWDRNG